jgi:NSS family neurotransmitter:Na+ symporter
MGAIITYGSYVHKDENLMAAAGGTAVSDLMFAILAGLAIMPAVFAAGIEPGAGPGLIFQSVPFVFSSMSASHPAIGAAVSIIFFLTIVVAAMTSCISLLEVGVSFLKDRYGIGRVKGCILLFLLCGAAGVLCSLSFGPLKDLTLWGMNLFDIFDWLSSNILLLLMALLTVIFTGFVLKKEEVWDELTNGGTKKVNDKLFGFVYFLIKWVTPVAIVVIFITNFIF